jgi:hypothetical protein
LIAAVNSTSATRCEQNAVLREMSGFAAQRLMEPKVEGRTGAGHGERDWETRAGTVE